MDQRKGEGIKEKERKHEGQVLRQVLDNPFNSGEDSGPPCKPLERMWPAAFLLVMG